MEAVPPAPVKVTVAVPTPLQAIAVVIAAEPVNKGGSVIVKLPVTGPQDISIRDMLY